MPFRERFLPSGVGDELEDGGARGDRSKRVGRRSGGHVEEALDLGSEAVQERLDDFGLVSVGKFANLERFRTSAPAESDAACRARVAGPRRLAACRDQDSAALEFEQV